MSVIQTIRNKYTGLVIGAIIIALLGFLVMDAMQSNVSRIFSDDQTMLAEINGQRVDYKKFEEMRLQYEENMKQRSQTGTLSEQEREQVQNQVWNDIVNDQLINEELEKLGIELTDKELQDLETGPYADPMIKQSFTDPNTGIFDASKVSQYISQIAQDQTGNARKQWKNFEDQLIKQRLQTKYTDLFSKAIYAPKFLLEHNVQEKSSQAAINYVMIPYSSISDSSVKVSDDEIKTYLSKRTKIYEAQDDMANLEYIVYDVLPNAEDSAASLGMINTLRAEFDSTKTVEEFIGANSEEAYKKNYYFTQANIESPDPAAVINAGVGTTVGPVFHNGNFKVFKVMEKRAMPDSVKASHILIKIDENRNEEQAKVIIDSIEQAVRGGADFAALAAARSEDQSNASKGGDLGYFAQGAMVQEFNDACFLGKKGDLKTVKTQFGYHLLKVTDQKDFKPAVKLAVLSKALIAGNNTTQTIYNKATEFTASAKDAKTFTETAKKLGKDIRTAENLSKTSGILQGMGKQREISRWAFNAKIGDVSPIFNADNKLIIAKLVSRVTKGSLPDVASVRNQVESLIKRDKKGQILLDKYKGKKNLEDIALSNNTQVKSYDSLKLQNDQSPELAYENRVIGAAFNKANLNKSLGIIGEQGVFFIQVKNQTEGPKVTENDPMVQMERMQFNSQYGSQAQNVIPYVLKQRAKITDNRSSFF
ncbi:MAG: peptidylprolyl isomerase [Chitinophagaceae bacterium]